MGTLLRYLLAALLAGSLIYAFYHGLYETGVLVDTSTAKGYYKKEVESDFSVSALDDGELRLRGYHKNIGDRDLRDVKVEVYLPDADGDFSLVDTVRLGILRSGRQQQIDSGLDVPYDYEPQIGKGFRYTVLVEFDDDDEE